MEYEPILGISPASFLGNFGGYIAAIREILEPQLGDDPGQFETVQQRAEFEAGVIAAQNWLVERWGMHYPCPVCRNVEWTVSEIGPAFRPSGFLSFDVTCGYCGNTMQVVPGNAPMQEPRYAPDEQLQFPQK